MFIAVNSIIPGITVISYIMGAGENSKEDHGSKISQFYAGKTVFVTGATGFMGKVGKLKS